MSSDRRWVPIPVDDPEVERVEAYGWARDAGPEWFTDSRFKIEVPVPPGDQLWRDQREAIEQLEAAAAEAREHADKLSAADPARKHVLRWAEAREATAARLRAAFQLGEE